MALFVLTCIDKRGSLALRMATREAHFGYVHAHPGAIRLAGPFLDDAGDMAGSMIVLEAANLEAARRFSAGDPYVLAGLFESVDIRAWRATVGAIA
ncbi:MAG TPA: YciI family protein [Caulobacteraceae bacterium]